MSPATKDQDKDRAPKIRRPYRPYGLQPGETRSVKFPGPDERAGWGRDEFDEAAAERRAGCGG